MLQAALGLFFLLLLLPPQALSLHSSPGQGEGGTRAGAVVKRKVLPPQTLSVHSSPGQNEGGTRAATGVKREVLPPQALSLHSSPGQDEGGTRAATGVKREVLPSQALSLHSSPGQGEGGTRAVVKRESGRRTTRDRYRMGYMFGKRSGVMEQGLLLTALGGKGLAKEKLTSEVQRNPQLARQVAQYLDRNPQLARQVARHLDSIGDGFITSSELL